MKRKGWSKIRLLLQITSEANMRTNPDVNNQRFAPPVFQSSLWPIQPGKGASSYTVDRRESGEENQQRVPCFSAAPQSTVTGQAQGQQQKEAADRADFANILSREVLIIAETEGGERWKNLGKHHRRLAGPPLARCDVQDRRCCA